MIYEVIKDYVRSEVPAYSLKKGQTVTDQMLAEIFHKHQISKHGNKAAFIAQIAKYGGVVARNLIKDGILKAVKKPEPQADMLGAVAPAEENADAPADALPKNHSFLRRK